MTLDSRRQHTIGCRVKKCKPIKTEHDRIILSHYSSMQIVTLRSSPLLS
jgi:hypothetical protein